MQKFRRLDAFGSQAGTLNFKGQEKMHTIPGAIITSVLGLVLLYFATQAIINMVSFEELEIQYFKVEKSQDQLQYLIKNTSEENYDLFFGFKPLLPSGQAIFTPDPSLVTFEMFQRSEHDFSGKTEDLPIRLEPCPYNSFYDKMDE